MNGHTHATYTYVHTYIDTRNLTYTEGLHTYTHWPVLLATPYTSLPPPSPAVDCYPSRSPPPPHYSPSTLRTTTPVIIGYTSFVAFLASITLSAAFLLS